MRTKTKLVSISFKLKFLVWRNYERTFGDRTSLKITSTYSGRGHLAKPRVHSETSTINYIAWDIYILLDVLLCSIAEYFYELCRILASP